MEAAAASRTESQSSRQRGRRLPLAQLLFAAAGVALVVICGAYVLRFVSATTFHKERAFRVLDEIGSQLDNLQRTLTNQLRLLPSELVDRDCAQQFAGRAPLTDACREMREAYQRRLALRGPKVGFANISEEIFTRACNSSNRYGARLQPSDPGVPFTLFACPASSQPDANGELSAVAFQGSMAETVEGFISQSFFDEVLVALADGAVLATIPRRVDINASDPQLHSAKVTKLGVANAAALLEQAGANKDEKGAMSDAVLAPTLATVKIADETYRVFIRAVQPRVGTYLEQDKDQPLLRQEHLLLIGLKHEDLRAELAGSMEPGGRFLLTVLILLAFLVWPLANLRSKSPDDSIAWSEAAACLAAVVLIPAVLAIAAVWVWSYQGLLTWADDGAARYAQSVATTLNGELREDRRLLAQYQDIYRQRRQASDEDPLRIAIRSRKDGGFVTGRAGACKRKPDLTCVIEVDAREAGQWLGWTPFSSVFATDARGAREGYRYTVYDPPLVKSDASYDNREYFRTLRRGEGWVAAAPDGQSATRSSIVETDTTFVAERLFSGSDGSRVLQIAVPRPEGPNCKNGFCGIVTGSASVHSLAAAVAPPLLSFAVIDRNSGVVIFHSDDTRSLAENFFVETERNPQLLALTEVGQSGFFSGHYVGTGHRFFHLPMRDTPWSIVVFYSLKEVGDLSWHAVFTALAAYAGALLLVLSASCFSVWLWARHRGKNVTNIAANFWVRTGSSCSYARWGLAVFAIALGLVTMYEMWADGPVSLITRILWGVLAVAALAVFLQHRLSAHSICISLWLLLISGIPAAWMALGYHDVQVQGLLRDSLASAARDIEHRRAVIASDLHRWLSSGDGRGQEFPHPWDLTRPSEVMRVPGYELGSCRPGASTAPQNVWAMCMFDEPPFATLITRRELDFWRRETWDAAVQAETQQRRIRLLGHMNGWNPVCRSDGTAEACVFRTSEGQTLTVRAEDAPSTRQALHADDDRRFDGVAGFLSSVGALVAAILTTWMLSLFIARRLLGEHSHRHGETLRAPDGEELRAPVNASRGVLFYLRRVPKDEVERLLRGLRADDESLPLTRVNLATQALYTELAADKAIEGRVLLTNLDIALVDAKRRRDILDALERLVENPKLQLFILCRGSPIDQLYHPERYPETGEEHVLALDETLRWDNVLQKFECRDFETIDARRDHPCLVTVDHHRTWKLRTRSERLLLYDLARGRLANPRNASVIDGLIARGLVKRDPWPKIADASFEQFVKTAETTDELAQWQRDAALGSGKRLRSVIIAILLLALLLAVVWFSWSAGDQFKVVSAIVAGAVAFLGQIGQAFNFVRGGAGSGSRGG